MTVKNIINMPLSTVTMMIQLNNTSFLENKTGHDLSNSKLSEIRHLHKTLAAFIETQS